MQKDIALFQFLYSIENLRNFIEYCFDRLAFYFENGKGVNLKRTQRDHKAVENLIEEQH